MQWQHALSLITWSDIIEQRFRFALIPARQPEVAEKDIPAHDVYFDDPVHLLIHEARQTWDSD